MQWLARQSWFRIHIYSFFLNFLFIFFFFFQAEDGIRDRDVTGVQTCALPILLSAIYGREYHIKRAEQNNRADAISNEADECETKLRFVRENIARGIHGIARNEERLEQNVIAEDDEGEREQTGNTGNFRGRAL